MSQEFFQLIKERYSDRNFKEKWARKCTAFFDNFSYLNSELLIEDQIQKLTHVGLNSIQMSSSLVAKMTSENMTIMEEQLSFVIRDMAALSTKFDVLEKSIKQKTGFFSNKTSSEVFFDTFKQEERAIRQQINDLNVKGHNLEEVKNALEHNIEQLIDCYTLLERDVIFLKQADETLGGHERAIIVKVYHKNQFELTQIKSDLLTHQQIIFQKLAGVKILLQNVVNCEKNINFISRVTYSAIMNVVELQQILNMGQSHLDEEQNMALSKVKNALLLVTKELKTVISKPFAQHN